MPHCLLRDSENLDPMMSVDSTLEELLNGSFHGDEVQGAEPVDEGRSPVKRDENPIPGVRGIFCTNLSQIFDLPAYYETYRLTSMAEPTIMDRTPRPGIESDHATSREQPGPAPRRIGCSRPGPAPPATANPADRSGARGPCPKAAHEMSSPDPPPSPASSAEAGQWGMVCGGCGGRVCDRFVLLAAGQAWHGACLRCSLCQCELQAHPSLYCRDGKIYCQRDYCRLFSVGRCARCTQPIPSSALVMRSGALTFHPHCFSCQECDVTLLPGNLYYVQGRSLYCQSHYQAGNRTHPSHPRHPRPAEREEGEEPVSSPEPRLEDRQTGGGSRGRTKRIRTCFRSEQLRAMESYFALKHNPDGKDWSCLSHRTGLPKRVLQVWFQNARAKLRRSLPAEESQCNSPVALKAEAMATTAASIATSQQSQALQTSTINHLELSLLTAPLSDTPQSPTSHSAGYKDAYVQDYNNQHTPRLSPLMTLDLGDLEHPDWEAALLQLQASLGLPGAAPLPWVPSQELGPGSQGHDLAVELEPADGWGSEDGRKGQREGWPRVPMGHFPEHPLEALHYLEGGEEEGEGGEKRNEALTSIAGGLQAFNRQKGGFGFRFGKK
ncbi:LIM/homeobox protein Lhx2-like [Megalops cyprinoides]|uniref:LIM/homeobox protein Lhx2-like n=1 Tax=Megalops cyprinoides TaxID=118141 RepID=UPI001865692E|nr:LIM/homeobox protein Lhx2-like [Megalops cyprinoides]